MLLDRDLDFEDAPIADIDRGLAKRLVQEGIRFGTNISRSPVFRRLELRGALQASDHDLAGLLEEAQAEVDAGRATRDDLVTTLRSVKLRGVPILDRLVLDAGRPGKRSDLGEWVVALSTVEPELAAAVNRIDMDVPATTTGKQALAYLLETWRSEPAAVVQIRAHVASAYRYVLDDIENDSLARAWRDAKVEARLYGKGRWHEISNSLVVADVRSPLIRQLLPDDRVAVSSAHLGDTQARIRRVADELGVAVLSSKIELIPGPQVAKPSWMDNLLRLTHALSTLEGRSRLDTVTCRKQLTLRVQGENRQVSAYLADGELMVTGEPGAFGAEAAGQLVEHFQMGQRGADSGPCRSVIPFHADHRFQGMPITDSGACRSPWSERVGALENLL